MNSSNALIYMADDDADDRYLMQQALQATDSSVTIIEAEDGSDLLTMLDAWSQEPAALPVHLILLDMNMPRVNGLEALVAIKANPVLRHIPAVMISTSAEPAQVTAAYQQGISGYIQKPVLQAHRAQIAQAIKICFLNAAVTNPYQVISCKEMIG